MAAPSERSVEIPFLLKEIQLTNPKIILDVGFAGAKYIKKIQEMGIRFVGMDNDITRIDGKSFRTNEKEKNEWKKIVKTVDTIIEDIVKIDAIDIRPIYDMVISISSIEHIVPAGYSNDFDESMQSDITAINNMKKFVKPNGTLLVTLPCCKKDTFLYNKDNNKHVNKLVNSNIFIEAGKNMLIYSEDRIKKMIGNWEIINLQCWTREKKKHNRFFPCEQHKAFSQTYLKKLLHVISVCGFHIRRPS